MVRAHRQAWAWQDEWIGLTMEDIREIERQTQLALQRKMGLSDSTDEELDGESQESGATATAATNAASQKSEAAKTLAVTLGSIEKNEDAQSPLSVRKPSDIPIINTAASSEGEISPEDSPVDLDAIK